MADGWTGTALGGSSAGSPAAPGSPSRLGRTPCGTRSSPPRCTLGSRYEMCRKLPPTLIPGPPCDTTAPAAVSTGTPPTLSPLMSPVPPGNTPRGPSAWPAPARQRPPAAAPGITGPHPRTVSLAGVAALADHLDLLPQRHLHS